jgi:AcrR family transcriptional regulator
MSDEVRKRALDAFLGLAAAEGYTRITLRGVAEAAGLEFGELYRLFPDKAALAAGVLAETDREVLAGVALQSDPEETARDRLFDVLMRRYDAMKPHRAAWRAIRTAVARDPLLALALAPAVHRSMAAALEAAGLASDGLAGALRQHGLLGIQVAVSRIFEADETADLSKTMAALDSRLKGAERWAQTIEKYAILPIGKARAGVPRSPGE